jgi:hypothetical protein
MTEKLNRHEHEIIARMGALGTGSLFLLLRFFSHIPYVKRQCCEFKYGTIIKKISSPTF